MAKIKHTLFQLPLNNLGKVNEKYESGILKEMNDFLQEGNRIYINHSITTTSIREVKSAAKESIEKGIAYSPSSYNTPQHKDAYAQYRYTNIDKYLIISLVYKELEEDEVEAGVYEASSIKLPNTKKALGKPDVKSEADKYIISKEDKK